MNGLTMKEFLLVKLLFEAQEESAMDALVRIGFHPKVLAAKAEKAVRRGYMEYGVNEWYGWVTDKGKEYVDVDDRVWIVTAGSYSDYHIIGVYRTEKAAEAWINNQADTWDYDVAGFPFLDDEPLPKRYDVLALAYTTMECSWRDLPGFTARYSLGTTMSPPIDELIERTRKYMESDYFIKDTFPDGVPECEVSHGLHEGVPVAVVVKGTDHERVRKVMGDEMAMLKARKEGLT